MPLKVKVTPPREGGGRVMSATDASKAKSTPPKTGTDAQIQRMNNAIKSLAKDLNTAGIRSIFNKALKMQDDTPSRQPKQKAMGGKTQKMAMGGKTSRSKKMYGGKAGKK